MTTARFPRLAAPAALALLLGTALPASAKLPAPSPEAAAKAAETAARNAWVAKVDNYKLCLSQDKVAAYYRKTAKEAKAATTTPACADPGPFAYTPPPLESAGAHSPAPATGSPPNTATPAASAPKS